MQEETLSPVSLLARFFSNKTAGGNLVLISGEPGAGKTTWCRGLVEQARRSGLEVDGLLSPAVFTAGQKVAIDITAIGSQVTRRLATRRDATSLKPAPGPFTAGWLFDAAALEWGNELVRSLPPVEVLVLDELGPLEILEGQGLSAGLERIDRRIDYLACVVVRPRLLGAVQERWPWSGVLEISAGGRP